MAVRLDFKFCELNSTHKYHEERRRRVEIQIIWRPAIASNVANMLNMLPLHFHREKVALVSHERCLRAGDFGVTQ